jgi:hypothetical protein
MFDWEKSSGVDIAPQTLLFLPPALRTDSDLRLARSTFTKPDFNRPIYNDDNAMASLEYLIINQFAANNSPSGKIIISVLVSFLLLAT